MPERDTLRGGRARYIPREYRWLGFRGRLLCFIGIAYVFQGASAFESWGLGFHEVVLPDWARVALWCIAGLIAIMAAWRPPGFRDEAGWLALYVPPAFWATGYFISWVDSLVPGGGDGYPGGWAYAAVFAAVVGVIVICSDWPEPPVLPKE